MNFKAKFITKELSIIFVEKLVSYPLESEEKQAAYFIKLNRWAEANIMYKELIDKV